jgi:hypothetical protein
MIKPKTHFEQVPLEIIKQIVQEEIPQETITERTPISRKKQSQKDRLATKKQAIASYRRFSGIGVSKA